MPHRVDRLPRYGASFIDEYNGPYGELLADSDVDELVLQTGVRGGVRLAKKQDMLDGFSEIASSLSKISKQFTDLNTLVDSLRSSATNVLDFGAKADGITDDSPAIQAAINYAFDHGMTVVTFPAGNYGMASKVYNKDGIYLVGLGHVELHRISHDYGTMIQFSPPSTAIDGNFIWQGIKDAGVVNLIFQYHGDTLDVPKGEGGGVPLALGLCRNIVILNCTFYNRVGPHTIEISGCKNVIVRDCKFFGSKEFSSDSVHREILQIEQSLTGAAVTQSHIPNAHSYSTNVVVDNCYFGPSPAFPTGPCCVGNHTASDEQFPIIGAKIINCTFDSPEYAAVNVYSVKDVIVSNCSFLNVPRCVSLMRRIPGAGGSGDWGLATNGFYFIGNFVEGAEGNRYLFESRDEAEYDGEQNHRNINIIIANNTFRQRGGTGHLFLRNCTNALVYGNVFRGPCLVILSNARGSFILKDNLLQDYTEHGVWNDERNVANTDHIGIRYVIDGNVFLGDHTSAASDTDCRAVSFRGSNNVGHSITISNNIIESRFNSYYRQQIQVDYYNYVVCHSNVLFKSGAALYSITNVPSSNVATGYVV